VESDNGEFSATPSSSSIAPLDSQKFYVTFSPLNSGAESCNLAFTHDASTSPDTILVSGVGTSASVSVGISVTADWNMLSIPALVPDYSKLTLFPSAISPAFAFSPSGYSQSDTLQNGRGYWLKFGAPDTIEMSGLALGEDTVDVHGGWNMIGSVSDPIPIGQVEPVPPLAIVSSFFGYASGVGYFNATIIEQGRGYWVKVSQAGQIILRTGSLSASGSTVSERKKERKAQEVIDEIVLVQRKME
jgi:hypothetical protein